MGVADADTDLLGQGLLRQEVLPGVVGRDELAKPLVGEKIT